MSTAMNERKIIDRKYLCDLAKEVGLTTLNLEALGENIIGKLLWKEIYWKG